MPLYHKEFVADAFLGNTTDIIAVPTTPIHGAPNKPKIKTRSRILPPEDWYGKKNIVFQKYIDHPESLSVPCF